MTMQEIIDKVNTLKTYSAMKSDEMYLNLNLNGNKKLVNNNSTRFIIWNLPAKITCPYATEHCKACCYAVKSEKAYPDVLPCRHKNLARSRKSNFSDCLTYSLYVELITKKYAGKNVVVRVHESGDFYNKAYVEAWLNAIKNIQSVLSTLSINSVVFMAYTKSIGFFPSEEVIEKEYPTLVIRSSIWDDTKPEMIRTTKEKNFPIYTAGTVEEIESAMKQDKTVKHCRCEDCATCGLCWNREAKKIICEIH